MESLHREELRTLRPDTPVELSRREALAVGAVAAVGLLQASPALAAPSTTRALRLGLIGCDSEGIGLAVTALAADPRVELVALADEYAPRARRARAIFTHRARKGGPHPRVPVSAERVFTGRHAPHELCALSDVDVVLLAGVVARRPHHLAVAVAAGKHAYLLPPAAVDMNGCRSLSQSADAAETQRLTIGTGLHWRHNEQHLATLASIRNGDLGPVKRLEERWRGGSWRRYQAGAGAEANWNFDERLSGGFLLEECLQSIDLMSWFVGSQPESATGTMVRNGKNRGNLPSHYAIEYRYREGVVFTLHSTLEPATTIEREQRIIGRRGVTTLDPVPSQAMETRVASVRAFLAGLDARPSRHDLDALIASTQTAILGREAARANGTLRLTDLA